MKLQTVWTWLPQTGLQDGLPFILIMLAIIVLARRLSSRGAISDVHNPMVGRPPRPAATAGGVVVVGIIALLVLSAAVPRGGRLVADHRLHLLLGGVITGYVGQISLAQNGIRRGQRVHGRPHRSRPRDRLPVRPDPRRAVRGRAGRRGRPARGPRARCQPRGRHAGRRRPRSTPWCSTTPASAAATPGGTCKSRTCSASTSASRIRTDTRGSRSGSSRADRRRDGAVRGAAAQRPRRPDVHRGALQRARGRVDRRRRRPHEAVRVRHLGVHRRHRRRAARLPAAQHQPGDRSPPGRRSRSSRSPTWAASAASPARSRPESLLASNGVVPTLLNNLFNFGQYQTLIAGLALTLTAVANPDGIAKEMGAGFSGLVGLAMRRRGVGGQAVRRRPGPAVRRPYPRRRRAPRPRQGARAVSSLAQPAPGAAAPERRRRVCGSNALTRPVRQRGRPRRLHLLVRRGAVTGLIGPNGAGKTTVIDALTGLHLTSLGHGDVRGHDITGEPPHRLARRGLIRTFQSVELFDDLNVEENLAGRRPAAQRSGGARLTCSPAAGARVTRTSVEWALASPSSSRRRSLSPTELSHGQRKLVGVGRALARRPSLLLLDEPAAGLDTDETLALGERLRTLPASRGHGAVDRSRHGPGARDLRPRDRARLRQPDRVRARRPRSAPTGGSSTPTWAPATPRPRMS